MRPDLKSEQLDYCRKIVIFKFQEVRRQPTLEPSISFKGTICPKTLIVK